MESTREGTRCRRCGCDIRQFHSNDKPLRLRHLPILDQRATVEIHPKRYRCAHCSGK